MQVAASFCAHRIRQKDSSMSSLPAPGLSARQAVEGATIARGRELTRPRGIRRTTCVQPGRDAKLPGDSRRLLALGPRRTRHFASPARSVPAQAKDVKSGCARAPIGPGEEGQICAMARSSRVPRYGSAGTVERPAAGRVRRIPMTSPRVSDCGYAPPAKALPCQQLQIF